MSTIDTSLTLGLCGNDLTKLIDSIVAYPARNPVARFCLLSVLKRVQAEWEDDGDQGIPSARAEEIDGRLLPLVRQFASATLDLPFPLSQQDLERLVAAYRELYSA